MAASSEEKGLLGAAARPHRRYGSTSVNMKKPEHVIKHRVSKQDTIQGIALRYGVTMESIKQHNKLWSTEVMFLHDYLDVPVTRAVYEALTGGSSTTTSPPLTLPPHTPSHTSDRSSEGSQTNTSTTSASTSPTPQSPRQQPPQSLPSTPSTPSGLHDCSETDPTDFLSKIDSNIALMRTSIERMETHA